ncbi:MAG: hypothetical protein JOZ78_16700 [Chroococcidiopsidaceae cyanobacterium CP_BM_ER_R8_30]|nr:hypothetical protein [Chroococcidiopsidaceae cyanobacterium CP_BM_ER_R8_30]
MVEVGNPLGYVKVRIGNFMLFPGTIDSTEVHRSTLAYAFDLTKILHWKLLVMSVMQELQVPFLLMVFLAFLLTINFILRWKKQVKFGHFIAVMTLLIITGFLYWNTPYTGDGLNNSHHWLVSSWSGQFRYAFPFMGVLGVATAGSATSIRIQNKYIVTSVLVSSILAIMSILLTTDPEFKQLIKNCLTFF